MDRMEYAQSVARTRVLETRLLDKGKIDRMVESKSASEVLKILQETEYGKTINNINGELDYERMLARELNRLYELMYEISPDREVIDVMSLRYDYHNIKVLLKSKALSKDLSNLLICCGTIDCNKLKDFIANNLYKDFQEKMVKGINEAEKLFNESKDPQKIDIILDKYMYEDMILRAKKVNCELLVEYIRSSIDLINIKTFFRAKKQKKPLSFLKEVLVDEGSIKRDIFINEYDGSSEGIVDKFNSSKYSIALKDAFSEYVSSLNGNMMEKSSDNYLLNYMKKAKYISFGPEPLLAYITAKETEIKIIRIIMVGKINDIAVEVIRERLRDIYV